MNTKQCGMKRLMEEAATQSAEAIHYSVSAGIRVGGEKAIRSGSNTGLRFQHARADFHDIFGEPDVNRAAQEYED